MLGFSGNMKKDSALLVWDTEGTPLVHGGSIVLWRSFGLRDYPKAVSIPKLVEKNAELFKTRYLSWIYDLGTRKIRENYVSDCLRLRPGLNYWWLTLIIGKDNYGKSPQIDNVIRFLAFQEWVKGREFQRLTLVSSNAALSESINLWCIGQGVDFEWRKASNSDRSISIRSRFYRSMPNPIQAILWLVNYLIKRWPLRGVGLNEWRQTKAKVFFVSYLCNLTSDSLKHGVFESNYWTSLPKNLLMHGCKTNWLHIYVEDRLLPTASHASKVLSRFNKNTKEFQTHVSLDTFLSLKIILGALRDWIKLMWKGRGLSYAFKHQDILWPLIKDDWAKSLSGKSAINSLLDFNLIESAINILPKQDRGVYLQENQSWEFGLIQLWKKMGNGILIGAPHSTVRYWDLRYFFDVRHYEDSSCDALPLPDKVAVNGAAAKLEYFNGGYPRNKIVSVEALRYLYLGRDNSEYSMTLPRGSQFNILVLSDYLKKNTDYQMDLLQKAIPLLPWKVHLLVKPHPACLVRSEDYPELDMEVIMEPISRLICHCDAVFTSNATSAAVDSYYLDGNVIVTLNPNSLNQSPLRGVQGVSFVSSSDGLVNALLCCENANQEDFEKIEFFYINQSLSNWHKQLLGDS